MLRSLLVALQFMTRLPVPQRWLPEEYNERLMGQSVLAYPVVGLLLGLILWGVASLLNGLPAMLVAALLVCSWILLTGALHLDGLADCADAWVGGHGDRERMLAIMKDSFIGPVGVALLVAILLIKFAALSTQPSLMPALILSPFLSRAFIVLFFLTTPYVRENGIGQQQSTFIPVMPAYSLLIIIVVAVAFIMGIHGAWLLLGIGACFVLLRWFFMLSLGGMTGDTAGAMIEVLESVILVFLVWHY